MLVEAVLPTPSSEKSVYYDAPMAIFNNPFSSSNKESSALQEPEQHVAMPTPETHQPIPGTYEQPGGVHQEPAAPSQIVPSLIPAHEDKVVATPTGPIDAAVPEPPKSKHDSTLLPPPEKSSPVPPTTSAKKTSNSPITGNEPLSRDYPQVSKASSVAESSSRDMPSIRRIVAPGDSDSETEASDARAATLRRHKSAKSAKSRRSSAPPSRLAAASAFSDSSDEERLARSRSLGQRSRRASTVRTSRTNASSLNGGTFANGAGMIGPNAELDEDTRSVFRERSASVSRSLSQKQHKKLVKEEAKEGKRLSKIIQREAKDEKKALAIAMKELAELQKMQGSAIKDDEKAHHAHAKAMKAAHKEELQWLEAQRRHELMQTELRIKAEAYEASRQHAQRITELVQEKNREVELLRLQKGADNREREARIAVLKGKA
ncbi:hypothetical protein PUNSTDRAFT_143179 [Punctularia strigosozonata HHB-11173 SS5]|uniref:uncharacterized protein n=1 Tax=Punctularia strigosozonata (strain HHB-11173) TaxID=741275 RepID=UPI0004416CFA|nr:uncharacterized protein PUNSTDRAFT_143179 [Punctularia strigosozonata HHB-11173 SS5]EIN09716.1 hypothetical protein PUNSTDRAFT_143179 [Punctularia strigosozonata HHB-11173 SS5]